jgi:uncharacterized protein YndB with AHSA1/START domain
MTHVAPGIPAVRRSLAVSWSPEAAFRRFTADFAVWWPSRTHSIGGRRVKRIVFECHVGGRIYEELTDGRRFQWGKVTAWDPPRRVGFTWHPSRDEREAQDVEVTFTPEGTGTLVQLVSTGWERLGARAQRARKGHDIGWGSVLDVYAGRWSAAFVIFGLISTVLTFALRVSGKLDASIDKAGGQMPANSA